MRAPHLTGVHGVSSSCRRLLGHVLVWTSPVLSTMCDLFFLRLRVDSVPLLRARSHQQRECDTLTFFLRTLYNDAFIST